MAKRKTMNLKTEIREVANPDRWDRSHGTFISGRACIDGAEALALEMDRGWGIDRLRLLVPPEVREKFDRQRYLFAQAIHNGDLEAVRRESARMTAAYMACDRIAREQGESMLASEVMEVALADGTVAVIVPDAQRAALVRPEGRRVVVYTLEEIGQILGHRNLNALASVKQVWPGATVTAARPVQDPLRQIDYLSGLDTPFDDEIKIAR